MIFETERLQVRKLILSDLNLFHAMQSNENVMQFADGVVKTKKEHRIELLALIEKYNLIDNDFWIYAIISKKNKEFVGTVALVKDHLDDEIGIRFLEKNWNFGYGTETCKGLLEYCKKKNMHKVIAYVVDKNIASAKILKHFNFKAVKHFINDDLKLPETKYEIYL